MLHATWLVGQNSKLKCDNEASAQQYQWVSIATKEEKKAKEIAIRTRTSGTQTALMDVVESCMTWMVCEFRIISLCSLFILYILSVCNSKWS